MVLSLQLPSELGYYNDYENSTTQNTTTTTPSTFRMGGNSHCTYSPISFDIELYKSIFSNNVIPEICFAAHKMNLWRVFTQERHRFIIGMHKQRHIEIYDCIQLVETHLPNSWMMTTIEDRLNVFRLSHISKYTVWIWETRGQLHLSFAIECTNGSRLEGGYWAWPWYNIN